MVDRAPTNRRVARVAGRLAATLMAASLALAVPAGADAAITVFGSSLAMPATLNTAENLNYLGTNTNVPPSPGVPSGVVHTYHYGADAALWNTSLQSGAAAVPLAGQAVRISLEGCAVPAPGGPLPLTQIHFQVLAPSGASAKVKLSSQPFEIPLCGARGASGSTVTTYEPINLCVNVGDYVAFNEEGGFMAGSYQSGVGYKVLGAVQGSSFASFIRGNGTNNGDLLSPRYMTAMDGFAVNQGEELMMQVALGTGSDARYVCPGGSKEAPPVLPAISVHPQTDGINSERFVAVAIYCRRTPQCRGKLTMTLPGGRVVRKGFRLPGNATSHLPVRLPAQAMPLLRRNHGLNTIVVAAAGGTTVTQTVGVKIFS